MPHVVLAIPILYSFDRDRIRGIYDFANEHGGWEYSQVTVPSNTEYEAYCDGVRRACLEKPDGFIVQCTQLNREPMQMIRDAGIPLVATMGHPWLDEFPAVVMSDHEKIGHMAAEHLLNKGFRHFASYYDSLHDSFVMRHDAFSRVVEEANCGCHVRLHPVEIKSDHIEALGAWLEELPKPTGLLCSNDNSAMNVLGACRKRGIAVPDELAVIGVDNDELLCAAEYPPLTSIPQNGRRVGYEAAALLWRMLQGETPPEKPVYIPPLPIVCRESTGGLAVKDRHIMKAMEFIQENAHRPVYIEDLMEQTGLERRTLERRFAELIGRSPVAEILRIHLERAKFLLSTSDMTIKEIAEASGFPSYRRFAVVFKKESSLTPIEYRERFYFASKGLQ